MAAKLDYTKKKIASHQRAKDDCYSGPTCPHCLHSLVKRTGRFGLFWGCSQYPVCKYTTDLKAKK